jgi:hypothetical protein
VRRIGARGIARFVTIAAQERSAMLQIDARMQRSAAQHVAARPVGGGRGRPECAHAAVWQRESATDPTR